MDNNLRCAKSSLVVLRLLFRRALHIYVLSSILDGSHISWFTISGWVSILLFLLVDFLVVRVLLLFLLFPDRSFFFSLSDFILQAGLKSFHLSTHQLQKDGLLDAFSTISEWAFFGLLCYEVSLLLLIVCYRLCKPPSSSSAEPASVSTRPSRTHKSVGRINAEQSQNLQEQLRTHEEGEEAPRVEKAPGDYRSFVFPALMVLFTLVMLGLFGALTVVTGVAVVGLELALKTYQGTFLWIQISNWAAFGDVAFALIQDLFFWCLGRKERQSERKTLNFLKTLFRKYESHRDQEE